MIKDYTIEYISDGNRKYQVVDKIPQGYFVWNIGDNMGHTHYIPLCEWAHPERPDDYSINLNTLKAIHVKGWEAELLREATAWGINDLESARERQNSHERWGAWKEIRTLARKVLPVFERLTETQNPINIT